MNVLKAEYDALKLESTELVSKIENITTNELSELKLLEDTITFFKLEYNTIYNNII